MKRSFVTVRAMVLCATALTALCAARFVRAEDEAPAQNMATTLEDRDIERFHQQSERMAAGDVDVLMVGDSITHGWEGSGAAVWQQFYGNRKVMNFGIGGDRTGHVLWRIDHSPMDKISPKLAVVMIGTNNVGHGSSTPEQTVEGITMIVDRLKTHYPEAKILLLSVFPRGATPWDNMRVAVNKINEGLVPIYGDGKVENVTLLDIGSLFLTPDGFLPADLMPDFLHPNAAGYVLWASAIEPYIVEALGEAPASTQEASNMDVPWWKERFEKNCERFQEGNVNLLMVGDSITHGWDGTAAVWEKYYGDKQAVNLGFGGDRTQNVLWRLNHMPLENVHPKGACLLIGINNLGCGDRPQDTALGIRAVTLNLREKFPETKIVVLKVFPWGAYGSQEKDQAQVNELNQMVAPMLLGIDNVKIVDLTPKFLDAEGKLTRTMMSDLLHPTGFGYEIWGNAMDGIVNGMLAE